VSGYIAREVAERLRLAVADIEVDQPLERLGFDSLQAIELQARLLADLGVRIPVMRFLGFSSITSIAQEVVERIDTALATQATRTVWPVLKSDVRKLVGETESANIDVSAEEELLQHSGQ
jgi:acyl carrier protein